jgi:LPS-assembly protein
MVRHPRAPFIRSIWWFITLGVAFGGTLSAQQVTTKALPPVPPASTVGTGSAPLDQTLPVDPADLPQAPSAERFPYAVPVPQPGDRKVILESNLQSRSGDIVTLDGDVHIQYGTYKVEADHIEYNDATGDVTATGHVHITGTSNNETFSASRGTLNIRDETGRFFDVRGSMGVKQTNSGTVYTTNDPFLFTGKMVIKSGPDEMHIYDGMVTSCQLPKPDWQLTAGEFTVRNGKASARNALFRILNLPVLFLPFVTHPTEEGERQTGFLIPVIGNSSSKGIVIGEQIYMTLGRSADLTVGAQYFSRRGWEQSATFRYHGNGLDFANAHYSGLLDRGFNQNTTDGNGNPITTYVNQGGEDLVFSGRRDFTDHTRAAASVEYLSSYIYREAFTDNFNQAVSSDITSYAYVTHTHNGYVASVASDRYQGLKIVSTGEQIRIFHAPLIDGDVLERRLGSTPFVWSATTQFADLKRTQGTPVAQTGFASDFVGRFDLHPKLALPFSFAGFHFRPEVGLRDTYYQHSRAASNLPGPPPVEQAASLNRLIGEADFEVRAPVLERTFDTGFLSKLLGRQARHTIEPELHYRFASGVSDFTRTLRFDATDVVANKNELEYGFVQRLFLRPAKTRACEAGETSNEVDGTCGGARETLRWKLVERTYFDDTFGGVIVNGRRNVLDSTLDLSGVAFLTDHRAVSPIVSEMKLSATDHIDVEWDMNYDTHAGKFTQSNTFLNVHEGSFFGGLSHARLNAPGRFSTGTGTGTDTVTSATSDFSQLRFLLGYGTPTKRGLNLAANIGLDLRAVQPQSTATNVVRAVKPQYAAAQVAYNWNCCGFSAEFRKYELGSVRNENAYRFNFSLANIGTAGNLRRAERLFQ